MKRYGWKLLFAASLLVNIGVIAAVWLSGLPGMSIPASIQFSPDDRLCLSRICLGQLATV